MGLNRAWVYPATSVTTDTAETVTASVAAPGGQGYELYADAFSSPTIVTAPPSSASVFAPASYTANTASVATVVQNTLGYDAQFVAYFATTSSSVATFQVGVAPTTPVVMTSVAAAVTNTASNTVSLSAHTPAGYYFSCQAFQANGASVPAQLTIVANPL